jgi:tetratricopeptide (TPR) repeat protein
MATYASLRRALLLTSFSASTSDAVENDGAGADVSAAASPAARGIMDAIARGVYVDALCQDIVCHVLDVDARAGADARAYYAAVAAKAREVAASRSERGDEARFVVLAAGVAALYAFMQATVTGPRDVRAPRAPLRGRLGADDDETWDAYARSALSLDGEDLVGRCDLPQYLLLARVLLVDVVDETLDWVRALDVPALTLQGARAALPLDEVSTRDAHEAAVAWWAARVAIAHQRALAGQSPTLRGTLLGLHARTLATYAPRDDDRERKSREDAIFESMARLEASLMEHQYGHVDSANLLQRGAASVFGLRYDISGAMGFRTIHQVDAKTQLVLNAELETNDWGDSDDEIDETPVNDDYDEALDEPVKKSAAMARIATELTGLSADGSQILSQPRLVEGAPPPKQMPAAAQALLIAAAVTIRKKQADDGLRSYEMAPYTEFVGAQVKSQPILRASVTILQSRHERNRARTRERALLVLEDLVQSLEKPAPRVSSRMRYVFSTWFPPSSTLKKELGEQLVSVGMVGAALELFEEVELWDPLIVCLSLLGKKQQAADLVRRRLDADDTNAKLWCALGDALDDEQYYWKAWEVSGASNARARRSLARRAAAREDWAAAAEHWMIALKINPLFPDGWFSGGYACLKCGRRDEALAAFVRCTQIDVENGQAWNNVAALNIRAGRFGAAHTALTEAVKYQRTSWHTWENHAMVCAKVGKFSTSALALLKVLELTQGARVHVETIQTLLERVREARANPTTAKWILDAANWEHDDDALNDDSDEDESWANSDMGDLAAEMLSAFSGASLPTKTYPARTESAHPSGLPRVALQLEGALEQVLTRSATGGSGGERTVRETSQVWALLAEFKAILGEHEDARDARVKSVRALDTSGWRKDLDAYTDYATATKGMVEGILDDIDAGRGGSTDSARLHLRSVVKVGEQQGFEESPSYAEMSALLTKLSLRS